VALGQGSSVFNSSGSNNTAVGMDSLQANTTASNNTAVGFQAGYTNTTVANQTFIGSQAGYSRSTNADNYASTMIGHLAGYTTSTGVDNTYVGGLAGRYQIGNGNTALGSGALHGVTTLAVSDQNTGIGYTSLFNVTTGFTNTAVGYGAGYLITSGAKNTIIGGYTGNQDSLDIRTLDNYVVLSDGAGNRQITMKEGQTLALDSAVPNAGTGITFPASDSPSSNANTLDDYEEGDWTPNQGAGLTVVGAFSSIGRYTKIGNMVTVWGQVTGATSVSAASTAAICSNLPFALEGTLGINGIATGYFTANSAAAHISIGAVNSVLAGQALAATPSIGFTITYRF